LLKALGRRLIDASGDNRSSHFLRHRIDIAVQYREGMRCLFLVPSLLPVHIGRRHCHFVASDCLHFAVPF